MRLRDIENELQAINLNHENISFELFVAKFCRPKFFGL